MTTPQKRTLMNGASNDWQFWRFLVALIVITAFNIGAVFFQFRDLQDRLVILEAKMESWIKYQERLNLYERDGRLETPAEKRERIEREIDKHVKHLHGR